MKRYQISTRRLTQILFLSIVIFIGVKFYLFVFYLEKGIIPEFERPAGVEAFLPISALVSLKHWLYTGTINTIHPSALVLFLIICFTAFFIKRGFCSWVCPIGLFSEYLAKLRPLIFKRNFKFPYFFDISLRTLKYLVAGFFIYQIFYKMPINSLDQFIQSPYNRFADIKMLNFFTQMSTTTLMVLLFLVILSVIIQNFWCRYLCPYGAVLGVISFFSLGKIQRNSSQCTRCGRCEKACPGHIAIMEKRAINSSECSACLTCIKTCPEKEAIQFSIFTNKNSITSPFLALLFLLIFTGGITIAKLTDNWQNELTKQAYLRYITSKNDKMNAIHRIDPQKMQQMILRMKQLKAQQNENARRKKIMGD